MYGAIQKQNLVRMKSERSLNNNIDDMGKVSNFLRQLTFFLLRIGPIKWESPTKSAAKLTVRTRSFLPFPSDDESVSLLLLLGFVDEFPIFFSIMIL